ncbi:MAG: DUF4040 domain-containing protein, partial [Alphaproteobacteria bacterium]|nr:DUF4040 domain-containing protein [Alphaproteobacteria bacterium]
MYDTLLLLFLTLLCIATISLIIVNDLFVSILITGLISMIIAVIYVLLDAVDVALTEIVIGAGISTILFLIIIYLTRAYHIDGFNPVQRFSRKTLPNIFNAALLIVIFLLIVDALGYAPTFGDINNITNSNVIYKVYTTTGYTIFGVPNTVTMILGSFRGFDTLGEVLVILIGAIGVCLVLQIDKPNPANELSEKQIAANNDKALKDYITATCVFFLIPLILLFGFYTQFHADFGAGGGFQAGVMIAATFYLMIIHFGKHIANKFMSVNYLLFFAALGAFIYAFTGIISMLLGGKYLDYSVFGSNT